MAADKDTTAVFADPEGGLVLDPANELRFRGPFEDYVTVSLTIRNASEKRIAFKIKTTAPKRYCVKPNSGVLDSAQVMKVNVLLQPFTYDPTEKNKHKFMVQYMYLNDQEIQLQVNDILNMWKDVPPSRLLDLKLKCVFDMPEGGETGKDGKNVPNGDSTSTKSVTPSMNSTTTSSGGSSGGATQKPSSTTNSTPVASHRTVTSHSNADIYSNASDLHTGDFESTLHTSGSLTSSPSAAATTTTTNQRVATTTTSTSQQSAATSTTASRGQDKNENVINELKLVKHENEALRKEIQRLKEEEGRLRKLAISSGSSSRAAASAGGDSTSLADLLNNRLVMVILVLIAIIAYLLLFR